MGVLARRGQHDVSAGAVRGVGQGEAGERGDRAARGRPRELARPPVASLDPRAGHHGDVGDDPHAVVALRQRVERHVARGARGHAHHPAPGQLGGAAAPQRGELDDGLGVPRHGDPQDGAAVDAHAGDEGLPGGRHGGHDVVDPPRGRAIEVGVGEHGAPPSRRCCARAPPARSPWRPARRAAARPARAVARPRCCPGVRATAPSAVRTSTVTSAVAVVRVGEHQASAAADVGAAAHQPLVVRRREAGRRADAPLVTVTGHAWPARRPARAPRLRRRRRAPRRPRRWSPAAAARPEPGRSAPTALAPLPIMTRATRAADAGRAHRVGRSSRHDPRRRRRRGRVVGVGAAHPDGLRARADERRRLQRHGGSARWWTAASRQLLGRLDEHVADQPDGEHRHRSSWRPAHPRAAPPSPQLPARTTHRAGASSATSARRPSWTQRHQASVGSTVRTTRWPPWAGRA